ncbi:hypothetical protein EIN_409180 [Entamoeba invadens IP1]|uniref:TLDc domain-containing protein n=1 Tax=Entamoeba invadens IP1 TaxID=370355 RepID=A0A0A1TWM4_ENTIV|nr:hypothetical protein EIN_409180 [Entamoeba invadens IP1]ELP85629.1 hypothetical protein EIN_409180 [Entamoeba invadens IP1]|eukprot:XP_004184975.1 hypothetical protein EIN_409180 [Entamoeba invadens IP1]
MGDEDIPDYETFKERIPQELRERVESTSLQKIKQIGTHITKLKTQVDTLKKKESTLLEQIGNVQDELKTVQQQKKDLEDIREQRRVQLKLLLTQNSETSPLFALNSWTSCDTFEKLFDSDEMPFNQRTFQSAIFGRQDVLGIIITASDDIFGSFHTQPIKITSPDMNWTSDENFFVFSLLRGGVPVYGFYKKRSGVYCKQRSIRMVYDDETFYRVNNAFYLRPYLFEKKGKTWDDFCKDYDDVEKGTSLADRLGFTPQRVLLYQCSQSK